MRLNPAERGLPLIYFGATLLLVLFLPSVLVPRQPPASTSAEFAPNAPPDPEQAIISALNRGQSGTAGSGSAGGGGGGGSAVTPPAPAETVVARKAPPRSCRFGFGDPPRQTFSLYSGPCAPPCQADTSTSTKGVTGDEIRVAVGWPTSNIGTEGPVKPDHQPNESSDDRGLVDFQLWLNTHYEFCGRRVQLYVVNGGDDAANYSSIAARIDTEIGAFAAIYGRYELMAELARRGIISFGEQLDQFSEIYYASHHPYIWNWTASTTKLLDLSAEYACKKLVGKVAQFAGSSDLASQPRKFGIVYNLRSGKEQLDAEFAEPLAAGCGGDVADRLAFGQGQNEGAAGPASVVARLRQDNITTVVTAVDFPTLTQVTAQAAAIGYTPEWFITGVGNVDFPSQARVFMDQSEWQHAFGLSALEMEYSQSSLDGNPAESDCYRAVQEVDRGFTPGGNCIIFASLLQLANGIQAAGPTLTPDTFARGLQKPGIRPPVPTWSHGGGYGPTNHAYPTYAGEIWYDRTATNPNGTAGVYKWTHKGKKFTAGEWDTSTDELFKSGYITRREAEANPPP